MDGEEGTDKGVEKDKGLEQASRPGIVTDTNLGVIERVMAAIDSASLSGPPASYVKSADAKVGNQGVRPKVTQPKQEEGWFQGAGEQSENYRTVSLSPMSMKPKPLHYQAETQPMSMEPKPSHYQAATQPKVEKGGQQGY
ncbi:hypothetical protein DPMN_055857 [Dreissena polymorpha]|uniref:Uncharacterized protein n=1 Tax=Dreissena polymorpha TaxID=45954 RepID=A0A9D4HSN3_DREPO|nr:hypothetical protein DPMN_055857 [Dreissena polymorpha]